MAFLLVSIDRPLDANLGQRKGLCQLGKSFLLRQRAGRGVGAGVILPTES